MHSHVVPCNVDIVTVDVDVVNAVASLPCSGDGCGKALCGPLHKRGQWAGSLPVGSASIMVLLIAMALYARLIHVQYVSSSNNYGAD